MKKLTAIFCLTVGILSASLYQHDSFALSCSYFDELESPVNIAGYTNIVEAKLIGLGGGTGVVNLKVETIEVFKGNNIKTYSIHNRYKDIAGAPDIDRGTYKHLVGKKVVLLGTGSTPLCTDGIIELFEFPRPELLREFLRCLNSALKFAKTINLDRKHLTGLPGKICRSTKYNTVYSPEYDGMCAPSDIRLSWIEEISGRFLTTEEIAIMTLCPNPVSEH